MFRGGERALCPFCLVAIALLVSLGVMVLSRDLEMKFTIARLMLAEVGKRWYKHFPTATQGAWVTSNKSPIFICFHFL